jgi:hypothetical protein
MVITADGDSSNNIIIVRRDKVRIFSGCKSHPANSVAPAGSYRSGGGGNETAGASEKTGRSSGSASPQAVTRVNVEQASKDLMWEPTRLLIGEGRSRWGIEAHASRSDTNRGSHRGNDDGMRAQGDPRQHGKPHRRERVTPDRTPARDTPGRPGWRTGS